MTAPTEWTKPETTPGGCPAAPHTMEVHGNRPGDKIARMKTEGEKACERTSPGIVAGNTPRRGDTVPCRLGDIIAEVCRPNETASGAQERRDAEGVLRDHETRVNEALQLMLEKIRGGVVKKSKSVGEGERAPAPN